MQVKIFNSQTKFQVAQLDLDEILTHEEAYTIGRSADANLVLNSPDISRLHGKFFRQDGEIYYADLGSRNGSKVNDEIVAVDRSYLLKPGDVIQLGEFVFTTQETDDAEEVTVINDLEATVVSSWQMNAAANPTENPGALVKVTASSIEAEDPKSQTKALLEAINQRIFSELKAARNLTRDTYLRAVRKTRETIESNKLIDQDELEKEAEKYWQSLTKGTATLGGRLGSAAARGASSLGSRLGSAATKGASQLGNRIGSVTKAAFGAAWKEMTTSKSNSEELNQSGSQAVDNVSEDDVSQESHVQTSEDRLGQPTSKNKLQGTHSESDSAI